MKKIYLLLALATSLFATSCSQDELAGETAGKSSTVTFTVELPKEVSSSRAFGEGGEITTLTYAVYEVGNSQDYLKEDLTKTIDIDKGQHNISVSIELANNKTYDVIFWAQNSENTESPIYSFNPVTQEVTVNYENAFANQEKYDAFYGKTQVTVNGTTPNRVELIRPFAQLNIGASDYDKAQYAGLTVTHTKITVKNVYNTLNLLTGDVSNKNENGETIATDVVYEFNQNEIPNGKFSIGSTDYKYLAMNYILVPTEGAPYDVTITNYQGEDNEAFTRTYPSVPLQANYKTNVYGKLLTTSTDVNIEIKPGFGGTENYNAWDGTISEPSVSEEDNNVYNIETPSELAWLAAAVNGTLESNSRATIPANNFQGKTFRLTKDINLDYRNWTPIGTNGYIFKGTFDGQNHTIYNLVVNGGSGSDKGLFGITHDGEIKNVTINNAKVSGRLNVGVVAGQPYTSKYTNITVTGHIEVNGMAYVGGVGGKNAYANWTNITVDADKTSYVKANSVENGTAYRTYVGGVVGFNGEGGHTFKNITSNINVEGSTCDVGGLFGIAHYGNKFEDCVCEGNVTITTDEAENALEMGGIAGVWHNGGEDVVFTDCSFTGELSTPNIEDEIDFYYGGLVGCPYSATGTGKLIINSKNYVATAAQLQAAINAAEGETTLYLGYDIVGDVTVVQKAGVKITIEGEEHKFNGSIKVHSNSEHHTDAALTIKNVNFETSAASKNVIEALENGSERYSTNITVDGCTFTATGAAVNTAVGVQIKASKNAKVLNCEATDMHSLIQAQSCDETIVVKDCIINGKNGVAFKQVKAATVEGTRITALEYGIRFDGNIDNYGIVVKNNNVTAVQPFIVRKMTGANNTITLEGTNTLTTEAEYQIVITNGSDDETYVKPTGTYTLTGADAYTVFPAPFPVASWDEFTAALAAGETDIKLTDNIEYSANYQLQKDVVINLNGKSMTLPMINIHTKTTIKNGTINGKVYARKNSEIVFNNVKFSGAVADNLSTEGHLAIQGGCKSLYAKDCLFSPTSVSGSQTKPLSFEGGSSIMKFENCEFKSSPYKKQVYFNPLSATGSLNFTNCNFNNKTPNIMFAAACPLTNLTMSGTTKLGSVTLETNRAKDAITAEDLAYLRESLIANNSMSSVRLFYAGGSSEYIYR